jgi:thermitase
MEGSMTPRTSLAVRILCFSLFGVSPAAASGPSVGAPVFSPSAITAGASTSVRVSSSITSGTGPAVIAKSVNLLQVDASGKVLAILGTLNDSGVKGDLYAGDQIYGGLFTFNQATAGTIYLQVSAAFQGMLKRVLSASQPLEVLPIGTPTVPRFFPNGQIVTDANGREMPCDQVLVFFKPGTSVAAINSLVSSIGGAIVGLLPGSQLHTWQVQINCAGAQGVTNAVNALSTSSMVAGAEPNFVVSASRLIPNDRGYILCTPGSNLQNGVPCLEGSAAPELMLIRADQAWLITQGRSLNSGFSTPYPGPIIGIIDTGVDNTQEDLSAPGKVINGLNFTAAPINDSPLDDAGHGTGVAGIAVADGNNGIGIPGVSWASPVVAEKVLDSTGHGTTLNVAAGINDAVSRGAKIINLSLGSGLNGTPDESEALAIDAANRAGALVVAAAGNDYCFRPEFPAGFGRTTTFGTMTLNTTLISVGGIDFTANVATAGPIVPQCQAGSGSNFGTWVDIYAPFFAYTTQAHQCTLNNCFANQTDFFDLGTSFSAPFVSGAAALVWAANPQLSATDVRNILLSTADQTLPDPQGNSTARLDVFTAVFQAAAIHCVACPQAPEVSVGPSTIYNGPMVVVGVANRGPTDLQNISVHGVSVPLSPILATSASSGVRTLKLPLAYQLGLALFPSDFPGGISYFLNTWDSYDTGALFDSFSVSTSVAPYWELGIQGPIQPFALPMGDPLSALLQPFPGTTHPCESTLFPITSPQACSFQALFVVGGQHRGSPLQSFQTTLAGLTRPDGSAPVLPGSVFLGANTWLNFVLDTASPPNSDNRFPSFGTFHIFDITPLCLDDHNPISIQPSTGPNCVAQ